MAARRRWWEFGAVVGGCRVGRYGDEQTPLWLAANDGQAELARRLLVGRAGRAGVEVDLAEKSAGCTPLIVAAQQNNLEVAEGPPGAPCLTSIRRSTKGSRRC